MDLRNSTDRRAVKRYMTQELQENFLIQDRYQPDTVQAVCSREVR